VADDLKTELSRLEGFVKDLPDAPVWTEVRIVESFKRHLQPENIKANELQTVEQFESKWDDLRSRGYSWINLHAVGLLGDYLIVAIERSSHIVGCENTQVNLSGPMNLVRERARWDLSGLVNVTG